MSSVRPTTCAEQLQSDPLCTLAIDQLLATTQRHAGNLTGIRPAQNGLAEDYQGTLDAFSDVRGGKLYFPYLGSGLGNGPFVELGDGSVKLDFITGIGAMPFGHSHPEVTKAAVKAALTDAVMHGNLQQNEPGYAFSRRLLAMANRREHVFDHCFVCTTGVMAGENMLKVALQARHPANRILAFSRCFAGRTIAFSAITDKAAYRLGLPTGLTVDYVPFYDANDPEGSTARAVASLREYLTRYPGQHAAFIYELVQGEGGFYPGTTEFFTALMTVCREHEVMNLCDEVQTFARLPEAFAFQYFGLESLVDGLWLGKSSQACATLFKTAHKPKPGLLSQTFTSSAVALAAGDRILELLDEGGYFGSEGRIARLSAEFHQGLGRLSEAHPDWIRGPYGIGAMTAFTVFEGKPEQAQAVVHALFKHGVMSFVAGANPMRVRFLWPVGVTESEHITLALEILETVLAELAPSLASAA
jgi:acetylornithine aminotransferase